MGDVMQPQVQYQQTLAHRMAMLNTYHCFPANIHLNKQQLSSLSRLIKHQKQNVSFFQCQTASELLTSLQEQDFLNNASLYDVLPCVIIQSAINVREFIEAAYVIDYLQPLAFYLIYYFELNPDTFFHLQVNEEYYEAYLISLYLSGSLQALESFHANYSNKYGSTIYMDLWENKKSALTIYEEFEKADKLNSTLFILFVLSQDEYIFTCIINKLSGKPEHQYLLIKLMGISGYSKFVPFLSQALFNEQLTLDAFDALKMLLGEQLDSFIPLSIQFDEDEQQRLASLQYYGAKLLHAWHQRNPDQFANRMLAGLPFNTDNLHYITRYKSDRHGKWAALNLLAIGETQRLLIPHHFRSLI